VVVLLLPSLHCLFICPAHEEEEKEEEEEEEKEEKEREG